MKLDPRLEGKQQVFTLSIEPCGNEKAFQHPFHLGTDEKIAREFAEEIYRRVNEQRGCYTVALFKAGKMFDVYDGRDWSNAISQAFWDDEITATHEETQK